MLRPYRVLDLTDCRAELGPMILADMGADVIKVEPPGGSPSRCSPPLDPAGPDGLASLRFHAYNRNKRSVALDLDDEEGREAFLALVETADFLFENGAPGEWAARGLGFEDLQEVNPALVYVAITPFGQDGPYAGHRATDLTLAAMGGMMAMTGDRDRPPLRISVPQCWLHASAESAVAALVAHFRRLRTGCAQFVDVSVQAAVFWTGLNAMIAHAVQGKDMERAGSRLQTGLLDMPVVHPASDGEVVVAPIGSTMGPLVRWFVQDGVAPEWWLTAEDWATYDRIIITGQGATIPVDDLIAKLGEFTRRHPKMALLERGLPEGMTLAPVSTAADVMAFPHLEARRYWHASTLPGGKDVRLPGPFTRPRKTALSIRRPAPALGEHTAEVLADGRRPASPMADLPGGKRGLPFAGIKVADFSWIGVGPITAKYLADHGADVIRVEATNPPDRLRLAGPHKDGIPGPNRSQFFGAFNTSKRSITLDLRDPAALDVARRLVRWSDVVLESFTPGTIGRLGLGYEDLRALRPDLVMVSTCLMGQSGPAASMAGYGYHGAAVSGFYEVTGWPDRPPGGPFNAYTDVIAPRFLAATVMAALDHRRRTGEGQYIEQAQMESALHFLAPELLDWQVNGVSARRIGNDSPFFAPHGAFPCLGEDRWIAIAVTSDEEWQALRRLMGDPAWARDAGLENVEGRLARFGCRAKDPLDKEIAAWTAGQGAYALMQLLQAAGIPAGVVQRSSDHLEDPQLLHRKFFRPLVHPEMGEVPYEGHQFRIRDYDSGPRRPAPCLGEHTLEILREDLEMTEAEVEAAILSGAVGC